MTELARVRSGSGAAHPRYDLHFVGARGDRWKGLFRLKLNASGSQNRQCDHEKASHTGPLQRNIIVLLPRVLGLLVLQAR